MDQKQVDEIVQYIIDDGFRSADVIEERLEVYHQRDPYATGDTWYKIKVVKGGNIVTIKDVPEGFNDNMIDLIKDHIIMEWFDHPGVDDDDVYIGFANGVIEAMIKWD